MPLHPREGYVLLRETSTEHMSLPIPNPDVLQQPLNEEIVLVDLRTNQIFALNETGARFWVLLSERRPRVEIERALLSEFDVTPDELGREIDRLLAELEARDLVRPR